MTALAADAAAALVTAMPGERWGLAKARAVELFTLADPAQSAAMAGRLDRSATALREATYADLSRTRSALQVAWRTRFEELLETRPEISGQLRALVSQLGG